MSPTDFETIVCVALDLRASGAACGHRRLLLVEGDADWGRAAARAVVRALNGAIADRQVQWIGNGSDPDALPPSKAAGLLGGECDLLVIDAHGGFDADALGAAGGTLRGGGLLLLLTPDPGDWSAMTDPEAERIAVYPFRAADLSGRFIARLARLLKGSPAVTRCQQHRSGACSTETQPMPSQPHQAASPLSLRSAATADQQQAIDAVCKVAEGRARRPLVLSSDRGRGKSAALGIAAARLMETADRHIVVTAPRRAAADAIFAHARAVDLDKAQRLRFVAPDALLTEQPHSDLLLVDEAAGIPAPLLERMLVQHGRIVFATTVHGYEGTGRGFEVRFRSVLDRLTPGWRALRLSTPIRWAADDPLERLIDQALLLDAEPASDEQVAAISARCDSSELRFERLDRDRLGADESLLRQVFGLLVLGHYQTRPADLRHLLDGPNMEVSVLRDGDIVFATALTAREGRFPKDLLGPIFDGHRRPRGHLLPQTLSAHAGLFGAPRIGFTRIVRIAVQPAARARGLGSHLVRSLADEACSRAPDESSDILGASFGATPELLRFWRRCGLLPVQLGSHRNAASGAHAAVVLLPLTGRGSQLFHEARARLPRRLAVLLLGPLRQVEPAIVAELLRGGNVEAAPLDAVERRELIAFAHASSSFEAALPALHRLTSSAVPRALATNRLSPAQITALIACVLQQRPQADLSDLLAHAGKAETLKLLRQATGRLLASSNEPDN